MSIKQDTELIGSKNSVQPVFSQPDSDQNDSVISKTIKKEPLASSLGNVDDLKSIDVKTDQLVKSYDPALNEKLPSSYLVTGPSAKEESSVLEH